eukprot:3341487-Amphidinium_carterae.1
MMLWVVFAYRGTHASKEQNHQLSGAHKAEFACVFNEVSGGDCGGLPMRSARYEWLKRSNAAGADQQKKDVVKVDPSLQRAHV